jgi:hypothetical protein
MNCEERLQGKRPARQENFPNGPAFSPNFNRGIVERAYESFIYVEKGFLFHHASHARRHKSHPIGPRLKRELGSTGRTPEAANAPCTLVHFDQFSVAIMLGNNVAVKHGKPH